MPNRLIKVNLEYVHMVDRDSHTSDLEDELDITKLMNLNEAFAIDVQKSGINAEAVELGSLDLEREEYYNNDFGNTPRIVTNKGCIKLKGSAIDLIQIIQRN